MNNEKYIYNPHTLQYEKEKKTNKHRLQWLMGYGVAVFFTAACLSAAAYLLLPTPKEKSLERDIVQMEYYYQNLSQEFEQLTERIDKIQSKDAEVHRVVFGMDPIDESVWNGGTGGSADAVRLHSNRNANELLAATIEKVEKLKRKIEIQNNSLSEISKVALEHEDRLASIPSIKPVQEDKLKRNVHHLSGYGMRIHPVHKVKKMHHGIDFTAPEGTAIQATGNGVVVKIESRKTGYGKSILIDHGYGYKTLYGHLKSVSVKVGQRVKKGELLGLVGSTGTSTAPHCHYEVRKNNVPVNPIDYCLDGLSPEEYQDLVEKALVENQSLD